MRFAFVALLATACYAPSAPDCAYRCAGMKCPSGMSCDVEGFCRTADFMGPCMRDATPIESGPDSPSCVMAPANERVRYRAETNTNDSLGNYNGVTVGTSFGYTVGKYGSAFLLDGVDNAVTVDDGDSLWPTASFSVEAWIKTPGAPLINTIACKFQCGNSCPPNSNANWCLSVDAMGHPAFDFRPDATTTITTVTATLAIVNDNAWHHVLAVRDSSNLLGLIYVDGSLEVSSSAAAAQFGAMTNTDSSLDPVTIGAKVVGNMSTLTYWFTGAIDDVSIYMSALTASDAAALANAPQGKCP